MSGRLAAISKEMCMSSPYFGENLVRPVRAYYIGLHRAATISIFSKNLCCRVAVQVVSIAISVIGFLITAPLGALGLICKFTAYSFSKQKTNFLDKFIEVNFLNVNGEFCGPEGPLAQLNTQSQFDNAVILILHTFALADTEAEREIIAQTLLKHSFSTISEHISTIQNDLTDVAIKVMENILHKKFNNPSHAYEITKEILRRTNSTYFHGTNIPALKNIKEIGLSRDKRVYDTSKIDAIHEIGKRILNGGDIFKWYSNQPKKAIYVTEGARTAWHFSKRSPEWFASFFESITNQGETDTPFFAENRNKMEAIDAVRIKLDEAKEENKINEEEASKVLSFAEEYWEEYGDPSGVILMIKTYQQKKTSLSRPTSTSCEAYLSKIVELMRKRTSELDTAGIQISGRDFQPGTLIGFRIPFVRINGPAEYDIFPEVG